MSGLMLDETLQSLPVYHHLKISFLGLEKWLSGYAGLATLPAPTSRGSQAPITPISGDLYPLLVCKGIHVVYPYIHLKYRITLKINFKTVLLASLSLGLIPLRT